MPRSTGQETPRPPTIPACGGCGKQRVLYAGYCSGCIEDEEREENGRG